MPTSRLISPGELAPHQKVTILEWTRRDDDDDSEDLSFRRAVTMGGPFSPWGSPAPLPREQPKPGDLLEVMGVCLPFVLVRDMLAPMEEPVVIDTRRATLMELNRQFVRARLGAYQSMVAEFRGSDAPAPRPSQTADPVATLVASLRAEGFNVMSGTDLAKRARRGKVVKPKRGAKPKSPPSSSP